MDRPRQLVGEQRIDPALARDAALPGEGGGDDLDVKVAFPLGTGTGMAGMPVRTRRESPAAAAAMPR